MATKIAINGSVVSVAASLRAINERKIADLEVVAINDLTDAKTHHASLQLPTPTMAAPSSAPTAGEGTLTIAGKAIRIIAEKEPAKLPCEGARGRTSCSSATGLFTDREKAQLHIDAGAKKVIISAPAKGNDATIVLASTPSCTTRRSTTSSRAARAHELPRARREGPARHVRREARADDDHPRVHRTTRRSSTSRTARATSAARARRRRTSSRRRPRGQGARRGHPGAQGQVRRPGAARPVMDASIVDLTFVSEKPMTKESLHAAMKAASEGSMKNILGYADEPLVSSDYIGDPRSSIFDSTVTQIMGDNFAKIMSWYDDNEWGFSNRNGRALDSSSPRSSDRGRPNDHARRHHHDQRPPDREQARLHPCRLQRPARRRAGRNDDDLGRRADHRGAADHQARHRARRAGHPREPPRSAEGARTRSSRSSPSALASRSCSASRSTSRGLRG